MQSSGALPHVSPGASAVYGLAERRCQWMALQLEDVAAVLELVSFSPCKRVVMAVSGTCPAEQNGGRKWSARLVRPAGPIHCSCEGRHLRADGGSRGAGGGRGVGRAGHRRGHGGAPEAAPLPGVVAGPPVAAPAARGNPPRAPPRCGGSPSRRPAAASAFSPKKRRGLGLGEGGGGGRGTSLTKLKGGRVPGPVIALDAFCVHSRNSPDHIGEGDCFSQIFCTLLHVCQHHDIER